MIKNGGEKRHLPKRYIKTYCEPPKGHFGTQSADFRHSVFLVEPMPDLFGTQSQAKTYFRHPFYKFRHSVFRDPGPFATRSPAW